MNAETFTEQINRTLVWLFAVELIAVIVTLFLLYLVIKAAIRDGIRESGAIDAMHRRHIDTKNLPEGRAER